MLRDVLDSIDSRRPLNGEEVNSRLRTFSCCEELNELRAEDSESIAHRQFHLFRVENKQQEEKVLVEATSVYA